VGNRLAARPQPPSSLLLLNPDPELSSPPPLIQLESRRPARRSS
jgi:hypothetical protein